MSYFYNIIVPLIYQKVLIINKYMKYDKLTFFINRYKYLLINCCKNDKIHVINIYIWSYKILKNIIIDFLYYIYLIIIINIII